MQAAIKMLTKLVEKQTPGSMSQHLGDIMPGLLKAYDNVESSVRKAAVFCIVALHQLVGEATLQVRSTILQSCGSGIIYSGSGSSYELIEFRIQIRIQPILFKHTVYVKYFV